MIELFREMNDSEACHRRELTPRDEESPSSPSIVSSSGKIFRKWIWKGTPSIIIEPLNDDAKGRPILNHTADDISIGGWKLSCIVVDATDVDHSPPTSLTMKNKSCSKGEYSVVTLTKKDDEFESIRVIKKIKSYSSKRHAGRGSSFGDINQHF
ncbi:unnamed protein product [Lepeophtheirus salmonis]|uniref:(salmon louse) hypothetical protein n=1 Tax=Lepeophtheirus salmonis TaxID=72036 RepID=A0A7R8CBU6_LEPSM|nr:unnamed protein product [Lepeophtheirus salmonis]CAF2764034.1 unnamed protein product [Lepeophtheirus salmonis]